MQRINTPTAVNNLYVEKDPALGIPATEVSAVALNALQEEVSNAVEASGASLNPADNTQLASAIASLALPGSARKNRLINSGMSISQRFGTTWRGLVNPDVLSVTSSSDAQQYFLDRWAHDAPSGTGTLKLEQIPFDFDITAEVLPQDQNTYPQYLNLEASVAYASGDLPTMFQRMEGVRTLAGMEVVFSFYARINSGTSTVTPKITQVFGAFAGNSPDVVLTGSPITLTSSWARYESAFTLGSLSGKVFALDLSFFQTDFLEARLEFETAQTFDIDIANPQLEPGTVATTWEPEPFATELAACLRYYESSGGFKTQPGTLGQSISGAFEDTGNTVCWGAQTAFRVSKWRLPDVTFYSAGVADRIEWGGSTRTVGSIVDRWFGSTGAPDCDTAPTGVQNFWCEWVAIAEIEDI